MNEQDTFDKLKRTPLHEMTVILRDLRPSLSRPVFQLGGTVMEQSSLYIQLMRNHYWIKELENHGWTYEDFLRETEKETLREHIRAYNESIEFPESLIEHAKEFFPDIKFTPAKIEFE